jgi:hypothetical protein
MRVLLVLIAVYGSAQTFRAGFEIRVQCACLIALEARGLYMNGIVRWYQFDEYYSALLKRIPDSVQSRMAEASEAFATGRRGAIAAPVWIAAAYKRGIDKLAENPDPNRHITDAVRLLGYLEDLVATYPVCGGANLQRWRTVHTTAVAFSAAGKGGNTAIEGFRDTAGLFYFDTRPMRHGDGRLAKVRRFQRTSGDLLHLGAGCGAVEARRVGSAPREKGTSNTSHGGWESASR